MRKLLLADDSVTIQRVIELTFSGEDIQVVAVNDGEQAIARIPTEQPDVVLADIGMPRKGGYDVAAFVKGRPDLSHIPVLLLAGAFEPVDQTRAEQVGADGVLIKPFEPRQVIERVKELLAAVRPTISAEVVPEPAPPVEAAAPQPPAVIEAVAAQSSVEASRPETPAAAAPAVAMPVAEVPPVEAPAAPQVQSLDDLFESLNQALTERAAAPVPPAPPARKVAPEPVPPPAVEPARDVFPPRPATAWPAEKEWMIPAMRDQSHSPNDRDSVSHDASFDSAPFDAAHSPSTSAATLDDYFDRLSAAFSHTRASGPSEPLPDPVEDFGHVAASGPPAASHEWLGQTSEPQGLQAFESGEGDDNPILGAVSTLMARAESHHGHDTSGGSQTSRAGDHGHAIGGAAAPSGTPTVFQRPTLNGDYAPPVQYAAGTAQPGPSAELVELVTERVLARLLPELTESLRRLVRQEIARNR